MSSELPHPPSRTAPLGRTAETMRRAVGLLATDPTKAEALAREALTTAPEDHDARTVLATALRLRGDHAAARAVLEPLATEQPTSWIVRLELAQVLIALGQSRAAIAPLSRAVELNPGLAAAWRLLGDLLLVGGRVGEARAAYDRFLRATIADRRLAGAAEAFLDGRLELAGTRLGSVLTADPGALAAAHLLAEVLARRGRLADAAELLRQCVAQAPTFAAARRSLAQVLMASGKPSEALLELDRLLSNDRADNRCRMMRAAALTDIGDHAGAAGVTAGLLESFPDQPHAWLLHGHGLRTLGRIEAAVAAYLKCVELDPASTDAYWALANLKTFRFAAAQRAAVQTLLKAPALSDGDRANLHFTSGKLHEDEGRFAEAFEDYRRGNAIEHARLRYDPDRTTGLVGRSMALLTPEFFAARGGWGDTSREPIFIVGLPRSGSTLVDQILASHPAVEGIQERQDIQVIADWIAGPGSAGGGYPDGLAAMPKAAAEKLGRDYLAWSGVRRRLARPRFTDKAPWNFLHLGLIQLVLPNAKIIDVRRHPLACGMSIYRQHFSQGWGFSYDLNDIGRYYADYVALMAHVDAVLPGRVHRVIYEHLVADLEGCVRALLAFLDLPFDPACLRFFENPRAVATPSSEQVRRPLSTEPLDQWRNFEAWLDPLRVALGPVLDAYPAVPSAA
jgi:tetratricopeptide (TPR) repeat protein